MNGPAESKLALHVHTGRYASNAAMCAKEQPGCGMMDYAAYEQGY